VIGTIVTMAGAVLLVDSWLKLRPHTETGEALPARSWAVLLLWSLPFLIAPPVFSLDAYSYAAQGWLMHSGLNPYDYGPGALPGGFADQVSWTWRDTPAPYGPLSLQLQYWLVVICRFSPFFSAWSMRLLSVAGVLMLGFFLPRIADQMGVNRPFVTWFALLNPLVVINFVGGCHNDALMMGFVLAGLWLAKWSGPTKYPRFDGWWWLLGAVAIGLGAAIKQPAIMAAFALPLIARPWDSWKPKELGITFARVLLSFAISIGTFCLVTWATGLGFGWVFAADVPGKLITAAPFTILGLIVQWALTQFGVDVTDMNIIYWTRTLGLVIAALIISWLAIFRAGKKPIQFLSYGYLAAALCSPALHTWYLQWGGTLAPLVVPKKVIWFSVWGILVLLSFDAIKMSWRNDAVALGIAGVITFAYLWFIHFRKHDLSEFDFA
jgi:alpha-1,6-mannosyltransferase